MRVDWLIEYVHAPPKDSALQIVCCLSFIRALEFLVSSGRL